MAALRGSKADATSYAGTLKRHGGAALALAEDVAHSQPVPGGQDNSADDWLAYLAAGVNAAQAAAGQAQQRLAALGDFIDPDGFKPATQAQAGAGYGYEVRHGALEDNANLAITAANVDTSVTAAVTTTFSVFIRVPSGIDPDTLLVDHHRGGSRVESYPRAGVDDWDPIAPGNAAPHYDYYQLVSDALGSPVGISGVELGDRFDVRVQAGAAAPVDERAEARIASLEDRTSAVSFDEQPVWSAVKDPDGSLYGKIILVPAGDNPAAYAGLDYNSASAAFAQSYTVAAALNNFSLVWVIPNNITWSAVRAVVRAANGEQKYAIVAQSLRGVTAERQSGIANFPAGPPDHTALWPAVSNTEPHSLGKLRAGDTITIEARAAAHVPIWEGELGEDLAEELSDAALERIDDEVHDEVLYGMGDVNDAFVPWRWRDYRNGIPERVIANAYHHFGGNAEVVGLAIQRSTGAAFVSWIHDNPSTNSFLLRTDLETGETTRVGSADHYGVAALNDAATLTNWQPHGIAIAADDRTAYVIGYSTNQGGTVGYATIHQLNLETGVAGAKLHQIAGVSGLGTSYRSIAVTPDGTVYASTRTNLYTVNLTDGTRTLRNTSSLTDQGSQQIESIAWSRRREQLVGLGTDGRIYAWHASEARFERAAANAITGDARRYAISFDLARRGDGLDLSREIVSGPVLIGTTNVLPTAAATLRPSVTIGLAWTADGVGGVSAGGTQAHPFHELRIPKVLPSRFSLLRAEVKVGGVITHRPSILIGGSSDDSGDVVTFHNLHVSSNQRLELEYEHYRDQAYDGIRINGAGTSLPADTTVQVYAI